MILRLPYEEIHVGGILEKQFRKLRRAVALQQHFRGEVSGVEIFLGQLEHSPHRDHPFRSEVDAFYISDRRYVAVDELAARGDFRSELTRDYLRTRAAAHSFLAGQCHVTELNDNATEDAMQQYFKNISAYKPYTHEEEMELGYKIQQGDKEALKNLILANLKFVVSIANKYKNQDIPLLDLINQGNIGLLEAAKRYDPSKGTKFITYAVWWIKQAIIQAVNEQGSAVKMPVKHTAYLYKINSATEKLTKDLGKVPSIEEISKATDIPMEEIEEVLMASKSYLSLDNYIGNSEDKTFLDSIEDEDSNVEKVIIAKALKSSIDEIISSLDPRESEIIIKRYGFDGGQPQTLEELGESMGVSRERVRQLENRALEKLKKKALKKKLNDYLN